MSSATKTATRTIIRLILIGIVAANAACVVVEPREGYYDHEHARYYHEHTWHECHEHDEYCR